jgi:transposase
MHSTWTQFAGLPLVFNLVRSLKLDEIIQRVSIKARQYSAVQLILLIVTLRIIGSKRVSHVNQIDDLFLRDSLGFETLPDQSTINRFLGKIDKGTRRLLFTLSTKTLVEAGKVSGEILAIDSHFIPYYGKFSPLAKKGYCATRGKCVPGFKLVTVFDAQSGTKLAYRTLPGNVDPRRVLFRLLRDTFELIDKRGVKYLLVDKGFYDEKVFTRLNAEKVYFVIPAKRYASIIKALFSLDPEAKDELVFGSNVVETTYVLKKSKLQLRLIFKFCPQEDGKDKVFEFLTNSPVDEAAQIIEKYRKRWRLENAYAELKNDWHIDKLPSSSFDKIDTYIMLTLIAYNLSIYLKSHVKELVKARISTLRQKLINLSAAIKRAAGLVYVDAVFKEHLPRGRIKCGLSSINNHLSEVIYS